MFQNKKLIQLLASALATFLLWQLYLKAKEENIELGYGMVDILSASRDIPARRSITADMITTKKVPDRFVEPGAFREKVPGQARRKVLGKVSVVPIPMGTQITQGLVQEPNAKDFGVAPMLPPGKRGYVLRLGNLDVAKLILPGDHIDILATFTVQDRQSGTQSRATYTILQNIVVMAVDKDIISAGRDVTGKEQTAEGRILTLAVDPLQAEKLAHAQIESGGEISVIIRAHGDELVVPMSGINATNLLDRGNTDPPQKKADPKKKK